MCNMAEDTDLNRFVEAQKNEYTKALQEIKMGRKVSHWMWYIFPQLKGLGKSSTSELYGIQNLKEARLYLNNPVLGSRLIEISKALLNLEETSAFAIFGAPDYLKLKSSMTLFAKVDESNEQIFQHVLNKYFKGQRDTRTISLLNQNQSN